MRLHYFAFLIRIRLNSPLALSALTSRLCHSSLECLLSTPLISTVLKLSRVFYPYFTAVRGSIVLCCLFGDLALIFPGTWLFKIFYCIGLLSRFHSILFCSVLQQNIILLCCRCFFPFVVKLSHSRPREPVRNAFDFLHQRGFS